jgi:CotS family spore coat protein
MPIEQIARKFGLSIRYIDPIKSGVYRLTTPKNEHICIKRMRYSSARLRWIDRSLLRLRQVGFSTIAWRDPGIPYGRKLYVRASGERHPYIATPWLSGRNPDPANERDLAECAKALARFHLVGKKVNVCSRGRHDALFTWPQILRMRSRRLTRHLMRAKRKVSASSLNAVLSQHGSWLQSRSEQALDILAASPYRALCRQAAKHGSLCHGDSGPKNFVLTEQGAALIDFETLRVDLRVYDLFRLIRLACRHREWPFSSARTILGAYNSVSKLRPAEYDLLEVWLRFPHKVTRLLAQYDRTRQQGKRRAIVHKMEEAIRDEQNLDRFLEELRMYARGEGRA